MNNKNIEKAEDAKEDFVRALKECSSFNKNYLDDISLTSQEAHEFVKLTIKPVEDFFPPEYSNKEKLIHLLEDRINNAWHTVNFDTIKTFKHDDLIREKIFGVNAPYLSFYSIDTIKKALTLSEEQLSIFAKEANKEYLS